jgi:hypothetical protein
MLTPMFLRQYYEQFSQEELTREIIELQTDLYQLELIEMYAQSDERKEFAQKYTKQLNTQLSIAREFVR